MVLKAKGRSKKNFLIVKILHPNLLCIDIAKESLAYVNLCTAPFYFYKLEARKKRIFTKTIGKGWYGREREQRRGKDYFDLLHLVGFLNNWLSLSKVKLILHPGLVGWGLSGMVSREDFVLLLLF